MIKVLTLNLWRYYDFEKRLGNIINIIKEKLPDIVLFQEVQIDRRQSPLSQVEIIKKLLPNYPYSIHSTIYPKFSQGGEVLTQPVQHGMAVLSRFPITNSLEYFTPRSEGEEEPRSVLLFDIKKNSKIFKLVNIHFANNEDWAKKQMEDLIKFIDSRGEKRIMAGDFNMYDLPKYTKLIEGYKLSYIHKEYISFPKDDWCLDYVAIPDTMSFSSVEMIEEYLSDHKGLLTTITNKK